jgi:stress-induced morphogen
MAIKIVRGKSDKIIEGFIRALQAYEDDHPDAQVDIYRQNSVSVRVRIIDPHFNGTTKVERSKAVWQYLDALPDEVQSDLSTLILLTPEETKMSLANFEFDDPIPSHL